MIYISLQYQHMHSSTNMFFNFIETHSSRTVNFTFMLPCIVIDLFFNNQPEALFIHIYSVIVENS